MYSSMLKTQLETAAAVAHYIGSICSDNKSSIRPSFLEMTLWNCHWINTVAGVSYVLRHVGHAFSNYPLVSDTVIVTEIIVDSADYLFGANFLDVSRFTAHSQPHPTGYITHIANSGWLGSAILTRMFIMPIDDSGVKVAVANLARFYLRRSNRSLPFQK